MKKNLIALAVLGAFSGAALAQSNVTLYGIIDVNYQYNDLGRLGQSRPAAFNSGHQSGSRWGIRGSEALSPNLNAVFTLEGGLTRLTRAIQLKSIARRQPAALFGRQAWGGLVGRLGNVGCRPRRNVFVRHWLIRHVRPHRPVRDRLWRFERWVRLSRRRMPCVWTTRSCTNRRRSGGFKFGAGYSFNGAGAEVAGSGNNIEVCVLRRQALRQARSSQRLRMTRLTGEWGPGASERRRSASQCP